MPTRLHMKNGTAYAVLLDHADVMTAIRGGDEFADFVLLQSDTSQDVTISVRLSEVCAVVEDF